MMRSVTLILMGMLLGSALTLAVTLGAREDCRIVTSGDPADPEILAMVNDQGWSLRQIAVFPSGYADWHLCHR